VPTDPWPAAVVEVYLASTFSEALGRQTPARHLDVPVDRYGVIIGTPDRDESATSRRTDSGLGNRTYPGSCNGCVYCVAALMRNLGSRVGGGFRAGCYSDTECWHDGSLAREKPASN